MFLSDEFFRNALEKRRQNNSLRTLVPENSLIDFCSTDYLGFAKSEELKEKIKSAIDNWQLANLTSSTGSRLMRGNYSFTEELEKKIASYHKAESALVFNSGYDANVGLFSCVPQRGDIILYDELIHVSSRDGMRISLAKNFSFKHNGVQHLENRINQFQSKIISTVLWGQKSKIFIAVESVYSMDGDFSPLNEISEICEKYNAHLIVDEAHATGVFGTKGEGRVVELGLEKKVFAVVHTFGKGLGCHGATILGSNLLRDFLINFSHSIIYSTAIPPINLIALNYAYELLNVSKAKILNLRNLIKYFKDYFEALSNEEGLGGLLIPSESPIQCLIIPGNERVKSVAKKIQENGYDVRAVLSPTVPKNRERLRICLHAFNTEKEIDGLIDAIKKSL